MSTIRYFKPKPIGHHQKQIERLRFDPDFTEIQLRAIKDFKNKKRYIREAREKFNLAPSWDIFLDWYLYYPEMVMPILGSGMNSYTDEVTGKDFYIMFIDPETTINDVRRGFRTIKQQYKEAGMEFRLRKIKRKDLTPVQIAAHRLGEKGLSDKEIFKELEKVYPEVDIVLSDVSLLKRDGKEKIIN